MLPNLLSFAPAVRLALIEYVERDIETGIRELLDLLPPRMHSVVEVACRASLRIYPRPERSLFRINATRHSYGPNNTTICEGRYGAVVFEEMCADGRCSAPTFSKAPIFTGKFETLLPIGDLIIKIVEPQERAVYNVTMPKHIFFPGYVKLAVVENATETAVAVSGRGKGNWKWLNTELGPVLFETFLDRYLVPKVERRLESIHGFTEHSDFVGGGGSFGGGGANGSW